jgi:hypothetical protein
MSLLAAIAALLVQIPSGSDRLDNVELTFRDVDVKDDYDQDQWNPALAHMTFSLQSVVDEREDPQSNKIGFCQEKKLPVTTKSNIAAFAGQGVARVFYRTKIRTAPEGNKLYLGLVKLYVEEGNTYEAKLGIRYTVLGPKGDTLYSRVVHSTSQRWGRTYSYDNYMETIAGAFYSNVDEFLKKPLRGQQEP